MTDTNFNILDIGFVRELTDFLLMLQEEYGFVIDVSRICTCVCATSDIRDEAQTRYLIQSLVCKSEEDVLAFDRAFRIWVAQRRVVTSADIEKAIADREDAEQRQKMAESALSNAAKKEKQMRQSLESHQRNLKRLEEMIARRNEMEERWFYTKRSGDIQSLLEDKDCISVLHRGLAQASEEDAAEVRDAILASLANELNAIATPENEEEVGHAQMLLESIVLQAQALRSGEQNDLADALEDTIAQMQKEALARTKQKLSEQFFIDAIEKAKREIKSTNVPTAKGINRALENLKSVPDDLYDQLEHIANEIADKGQYEGNRGRANLFRMYLRAGECIQRLKKTLLQKAGAASVPIERAEKKAEQQLNSTANKLRKTETELRNHEDHLRKLLESAAYKKQIAAAKAKVSILPNGEELADRLVKLFESDAFDTIPHVLKDIRRQILDLAAKGRSSGDASLFQKGIKAASEVDELNKSLPITNKDISMLVSLRLESVKAQAEASKSQALDMEYEKAVKEVQAAKEKAKAAEESRQEAETAANIARTRGEEAVIKEQSLTHRPDSDVAFVNGRSVMTLNAKAELLERDIKTLSQKEQQEVLTYIRDNAIAFKHTMRRQTASISKRRVDVRETMKAAMRTDGEPFIIKYRKPKKSHAKVVCLVDMSGSCRNASTLALYFMALMNDVFSGGCHKFVFVNRLVPVDDMFRGETPQGGVFKVEHSVPTRGIYSDYGTPIKQLHESYIGLFNKETTVIVIGDARTNSHDGQLPLFKDICDKSRNVFWLNPDNPAKWNQGDSIIADYEKAGAKISHLSNVGELLTFLSGLKAG